MFERKSEAYQFSWYDVWAVVREGLLLAVPWFVVNIGVVEQQLLDWNWNVNLAAFVAFFVLEAGRRFIKNYSR